MLSSDKLTTACSHWWPETVRQLLFIADTEEIWPLDIGLYASLRAYCSYMYAGEIMVTT